MTWPRLTRGVAEFLALVGIPAGGLYGALCLPLTPLSASLYAAMMGLVPLARVLDLRRRNGDSEG